MGRKKKYPTCADYERDRKLRDKYGISLEDYNAMYIEQGGSCWICKEPAPLAGRGRGGRLHVDHCHSTGKVRGLLCYACNGLLGMADDDVFILERSIQYLRMGR